MFIRQLRWSYLILSYLYVLIASCFFLKDGKGSILNIEKLDDEVSIVKHIFFTMPKITKIAI